MQCSKRGAVFEFSEFGIYLARISDFGWNGLHLKEESKLG